MNNQRCIIIGSSPYTDPLVLRKWIQKGDYIACADGGHVFARQLGIVPSLVIGDFDSSAPPANDTAAEIIRLPVEKDDTDTVSVVRHCMQMGFDTFLLFGMTGGRFDHTLANLSVLYHLARNGRQAYMIDAGSITRVLTVGTVAIDGHKGCGFGIFPFACEQISVSLSGFAYPLDHGDLTADYPVGVSNTILSDHACITLHSGTAVYTIS